MPFPPHGEQQAIAAFLDRETAKIDALVAEQERLLVLLEEKRQAAIANAVTKGLDPTVPTKDSGVEWLGQVPAHWIVVPLGRCFGDVSEAGDLTLPILSVSIHSGVSDHETSEHESERKVTRSEDRSTYKRVEPGDLVYNMMRAWQGGFGTVKVEGLVSPAYVVARPLRELLTEFVELLLRTPSAIVEMKRHSKGIIDFRLRLYWDEGKTISIALPSICEQKAILDYISTVTLEMSKLADECRYAAGLLGERRAALISAAVTGKLDVRALTSAAEPALAAV